MRRGGGGGREGGKRRREGGRERKVCLSVLGKNPSATPSPPSLHSHLAEQFGFYQDTPTEV